MKSLITITAFASLGFIGTSAIAGGGGNCHFHGNAPIKESVIVGCATDRKDTLVSSGKIPATWKDVKVEKSETVEGQNMKEWKLTFKNLAEKDASKQNLYMFYSLTGNFIAANFNGK
jgi:hypothetical protein